jgi:sirohydrochlorin cobaltochelatase
MNNDSKKTGMLIVGHGSKLPYNKEVVSEIAEKLNDKIDYIVERGFMELVLPNIPQQVDKLKEQGMERIIVVPAFLAHGVHTKVDIPTILKLPHEHIGLDHSHTHHHHHHHHHHHGEDDEREAKSDLIDFDGEVIYLEPFGADDKVVDVVENRINECISNNNLNNENSGILLVGHGSSLPFGKEVLMGVTNKIKERMSEYEIDCGFMQIETPLIPESFKKLQDNGFENMIVVPVFLADGLHTKNDIPNRLGLEPMELDFNYRKIEKQIDYDGNIYFLNPLKAEDEIVDMIECRIQEYI